MKFPTILFMIAVILQGGMLVGIHNKFYVLAIPLWFAGGYYGGNVR